jgi:hypothetical protein
MVVRTYNVYGEKKRLQREECLFNTGNRFVHQFVPVIVLCIVVREEEIKI